jgi:23S rRNA pseudouridine2457 synthase
MSKLILFNKPFNVLSQFTDTEGRATLVDYIPYKDVYAVGRLDYDSEGLLLLTDSGALKHQIAHPDSETGKTYWVQVEGSISDEAIERLEKGVLLKDGMTRPALARVITAPDIWDRQPPIRVRQQIPTSWLELTITEGRNRQVRRMTAHTGYPTLRLIRVATASWRIGELKPGEFLVLEVNAPSADSPALRSPGRKNHDKPYSSTHNKQRNKTFNRRTSK